MQLYTKGSAFVLTYKREIEEKWQTKREQKK
jgi:hypothetical protein